MKDVVYNPSLYFSGQSGLIVTIVVLQVFQEFQQLFEYKAVCLLFASLLFSVVLLPGFSGLGVRHKRSCHCDVPSYPLTVR